jgi:hypothetical protein
MVNPANIQLEGVYLALTAITELLVEKGIVTREELDRALHKAEARATSDERARDLSLSNRDSMVFAIRFLREANGVAADGEELSFSELTRRVGERKRPYNDQM